MYVVREMSELNDRLKTENERRSFKEDSEN